MGGHQYPPRSPKKEVYTRILPKKPQTLESFRQEHASKLKQKATLLDKNVNSKGKEEVASSSRNKCRRILILIEGSLVEVLRVLYFIGSQGD